METQSPKLPICPMLHILSLFY
ncbi:hypothetical protein F383_18275 [Gossypium arboreum]|uniref:Uncharacterized protein n=1 Tax=Gossypium arboreum TaxID=29729 RepID=A0A0B0MKJ0_GOSAR|nr:hypothetical protein F383_18275 [Gossypium arboreum]